MGWRVNASKRMLDEIDINSISDDFVSYNVRIYF
jgi:hypothetical protein